MSALLHPIGPEPEETYWKRRAAVLAALVVVLVLLIWGVSSLFSRSDDTGGAPLATSTAPETPATTPGPTEPSSTPDDPATTGSTPAASTSPSAVGSVASTPADTASATSQAPGSTDASTPATVTSPTGSASPVATTSSPATVAPAGPAACDPAAVLTDVTGASRVNTGRTVNLNITLTSATNCVLDFDQSAFELRIFSGSDRIWSSNDCSTHKPSGRATLSAGTAWAYTIAWNTRRSLGACTLDTAYLLPGTYVATAVVSGGSPAQHVMTILA